jgi:hypothetical protein
MGGGMLIATVSVRLREQHFHHAITFSFLLLGNPDQMPNFVPRFENPGLSSVEKNIKD